MSVARGILRRGLGLGLRDIPPGEHISSLPTYSPTNQTGLRFGCDKIILVPFSNHSYSVAWCYWTILLSNAVSFERRLPVCTTAHTPSTSRQENQQNPFKPSCLRPNHHPPSSHPHSSQRQHPLHPQRQHNPPPQQVPSQNPPPSKHPPPNNNSN